jgi:hypothetical protein
MWNKIILIADWYRKVVERNQVVHDFNKSYKNSFITGSAPTLLEARITRGERAFLHTFSENSGGGFRIKALSDRQLAQSELIEISKIVLENEEFVRKLIALGWDTLEIQDNKGLNGLKWQLKKYANIRDY